MDPKEQNTTPETPVTPTSTPVETSPAEVNTPTSSPEQTTTTPTVQPSPSDTPSIPTATPASTPEPVLLPASPTTPEDPEKEEKRVSLRTVLLIVVLAILAAVLLFIALRPPQKVAVKNTTPTPTTKPSQAHSTLSLVLADTTATPSSTGITNKSVNVVLDTQSNKVSGVQFEISYDPTVLTNVTVKPGDFFTTPLVLLNQVDTKNGKINYALGIQPTGDGLSGNGTAAVISYTLLPTASASQTTLKFLPKTQVVQQGISGSVLEKSLDISIPVPGLTPATSTSTSSAK